MSAAAMPRAARPSAPAPAATLPPALAAQAPGGVLLPYQQALLEATAANRVAVVEKSRRIGATWGVGADAVLIAGAARSAGGMDVLYLGYNLDMAREFIDCCGMWARAFVMAAGEVAEFLFVDQGDGREERHIKAFRITFASGFEVIALSSRPRSLRGRQGYVIVDEAAFHDDFKELMKSALALLIWGGRVLVISTHNGADSDYAELIAEVRAGRRPYRLLRITFDDALAQGLYRRICLVRGEPWSAAAEAAWAAGIRADYGEDAAEELDCIPRNTGGKYLARSLIEARMQPDIPVLRWAAPQGFVDQPDAEREAALAGWCVEALRPVLGVLPPDVRSCIGLDFGRHRDLTVIWVWLVERDLVRRTACVIELRDCPFRQQEQVLFETVDRLPGFGHGALDAGGNGMYLAEVARQRYGTGAISELRLSEAWYREWMPRYKAAFEDGTVVLPRDAELLDDHRAIEVMRGVPRIPEARSRGESGQRHGDGAIAGALGYYATLQDAGPVDVLSGGPRPGVPAGFGDDGRPGAAVRDTGWGTLAGGLDLGGWT